jgi:hypothetical protein
MPLTCPLRHDQPAKAIDTTAWGLAPLWQQSVQPSGASAASQAAGEVVLWPGSDRQQWPISGAMTVDRQVKGSRSTLSLMPACQKTFRGATMPHRHTWPSNPYRRLS